MRAPLGGWNETRTAYLGNTVKGSTEYFLGVARALLLRRAPGADARSGDAQQRHADDRNDAREIRPAPLAVIARGGPPDGDRDKDIVRHRDRIARDKGHQRVAVEQQREEQDRGCPIDRNGAEHGPVPEHLRERHLAVPEAVKEGHEEP